MRPPFRRHLFRSYFLFVQLDALTNADHYCCWGQALRHSFPFVSSVVVAESTTQDLRGGGRENNPEPRMTSQVNERRDPSFIDEHGCSLLDSSVDFSDNEVQKQILLKHYRKDAMI